MIRNIISLIAILTLTAGFLVACDADSPSEPVPEPVPEQAPTLIVTESPPTSEPEPEPEQTLEPTPESTPEQTSEPVTEPSTDNEQQISVEAIMGEWAQAGIAPGDEHLQARATFSSDGTFRHQWGASVERGTWSIHGNEITVEVTHAGHIESSDSLPAFDGDEDDRYRVFIFDSIANTLTEVYRGTIIVYEKSD
jgi:hypothetical protein